MIDRDIKQIIEAVSWLLERDHGSIAMMHKKKLEFLKHKLQNKLEEAKWLPLSEKPIR